MKILTAADLLDATDLHRELVELPELGAAAYVREMSGIERDEWESSVSRRRGGSIEVNRKNFRATLLVRCVCDENGERLFKDDQAGALGRVGAGTIGRLFDVAMRVNGISKSDQEELTESFPDE